MAFDRWGLDHVAVWFMREFGSFHVWEFEKRLDCKFLNLTVVFWPRCLRAPKFRSFGSRVVMTWMLGF